MNKIDIYFRSLSSKFNEKIKSNFSDTFFRDKVSRAILSINLGFVVLAWGFSLFYFRITSYEVPTRFNSFLGVTRLGSWYSSYELPVFLTLLFVVNTMLAKTVYGKDKLASYLLISSNIFLGLIAVILIINFGKLAGGNL